MWNSVHSGAVGIFQRFYQSWRDIIQRWNFVRSEDDSRSSLLALPEPETHSSLPPSPPPPQAAPSRDEERTPREAPACLHENRSESLPPSSIRPPLEGSIQPSLEATSNAQAPEATTSSAPQSAADTTSVQRMCTPLESTNPPPLNIPHPSDSSVPCNDIVPHPGDASTSPALPTSEPATSLEALDFLEQTKQRSPPSGRRSRVIGSHVGTSPNVSASQNVAAEQMNSNSNWILLASPGAGSQDGSGDAGCGSGGGSGRPRQEEVDPQMALTFALFRLQRATAHLSRNPPLRESPVWRGTGSRRPLLGSALLVGALILYVLFYFLVYALAPKNWLDVVGPEQP